MSCRKCGIDCHGSICVNCLDDWSKMRGILFDFLESKYGKMSPENHPIFITETKRLERIWRKDKEKFAIEVSD